VAHGFGWAKNRVRRTTDKIETGEEAGSPFGRTVKRSTGFKRILDEIGGSFSGRDREL
jgi:hypothetical protein